MLLYNAHNIVLVKFCVHRAVKTAQTLFVSVKTSRLLLTILNVRMAQSIVMSPVSPDALMRT